MASERALVPHDLRRDSIDRQRIKTHKVKWAGKTIHSAACEDEKCTFGHRRGIGLKPRPEKFFGHPHRKDRMEFLAKKAHVSRKCDRRDILEEAEAVTSEDDLSENSNAAPSLDEDDGITYSFDAPCGPRPGSHILSVALNRAVATFEGKQTDKLIKEEYEVVQSEPDIAPGTTGTIKESSLDDDLEDFELL